MNQVFSKLRNAFNSCCEFGVTNRTDFLKNVNTAGWVLSCLAQVFAIAINDKIPKKEKKFLVPQEILDGIINVTLFWVCTSKATDYGKNLVVKGKILPQSFKSLLEAKKLNVHEISEKFINGLGLTSKETSKLIKDFTNTREGVGIVASLVGSIAAANIITPIVRNKLASLYQKRQIRKENISKDNQVGLNETYGKIDIDTMGQKFERKGNPISVNYNPQLLMNNNRSSLKI